MICYRSVDALIAAVSMLHSSSLQCSAFQPAKQGRSVALNGHESHKHALFSKTSFPVWRNVRPLNSRLTDDEPVLRDQCSTPSHRGIGYYLAVGMASLAFLLSPVPSVDRVWADEVTTTESTLLQPSPTQTMSTSVVEEVWNLINKYYIDRTFNSQVGSSHSGLDLFRVYAHGQQRLMISCSVPWQCEYK